MRPLAASLAGLLALTPMAALAYDCDALITRMRQAVPAIAPEERKPGEKDRAITLIWHERVVLDPGQVGSTQEANAVARSRGQSKRCSNAPRTCRRA
jgi:hypothetical protein